jgi:hypothetical protein
MLVNPSSCKTHPPYRKPSQEPEQTINILVCWSAMTKIYEVFRAQVFRDEVLTPDPKRMLAALYQRAEFRVVQGSNKKHE